jgi:hypothetical protein
LEPLLVQLRAMNFRSSFAQRAALGGVLLAMAVPVNAQLAAKSPFAPPQAAATNTPTAGAALEYRGYLQTSEGAQFRLYDPVKKIGTWVKMNERNPDFDVVVKQHDNGQTTLTIEHQGKTLTLEERKSKVVSSGAAAQAMPPPMANVQSNVAPAVTQAVVLNPSPADEQRRLEAVASEVARRRALRENATAEMTRGANVPPTAGQPMPLPARNFQAVPPNNQRPNQTNAQPR